MEKSKVWKYFSKNKDSLTAQCLKCPKQLSIKGSNTSGLIKHLELVHKISVKTQAGAEEPTPSSSGSAIHTEDDQPPASKKSKRDIQQTLNYEPKSKKSMQEIVSMLAAKDGLTIRQITRSQFIRESLQQKGFQLLKNETGVMKLIFQYYEEKKNETRKYFRELRQTRNGEAARFSLSIDEWTSLRNRRYFNVCVHHTNGQLYNLGLVYIPGKCGATETRHIVEKRLDEFGLCFAQDVVAVTSDGPNVMIKFGRDSPTEMVICLNHAIHLSVLATFCDKSETTEEGSSQDESDSDLSDDVDSADDDTESQSTSSVQYTPNIEKVLKETRWLVKLFRKSPLKNITLQKYVKEELGHELNLLLDVRTRWNSTMFMVERFLKLKNAIKKALIDLNLSSKWNDGNVGVLDSLLNILQPIKLCVEALSRRDATILTSEAILDVLINKLESMNNALASKFLDHLKDKINNRRNINLISLINYLHNPSAYNSDRNWPNCSKTVLIKYTEELYNRLFPSISNPDDDENVQEVQQNEGDSPIHFEMQLRMAIETASTSTNTTEAQLLTKSLIKKEFHLFESTGKRTPNLENLYNAVMTVKPTSTENERVFSLSSNVVTKIRNRLSDKSINALVFLKSYFNRTC